MDLDVLKGTLAVTEKPGLDTFDPRFTDIATLVQEANFIEAGNKSAEILEEGTYDIRIIGYYLYSVFLEKGAGGLDGVFESINNLLTENLEAVGPVKNRLKHFQNTLKWFMNQLIKKLNYEEDKKEVSWQTWTDTVSSDDIQAVLDACETCQRNLRMTLEDSAESALDGLSKNIKWLKSFQQLVYKEPEPEPVPEEEMVEDEAKVESAAGPAGQNMGPVTLGAGAICVDGSVHLQTLTAKLAAFESLIKAQRFNLAALVADDINHIIANFDPKIYFPSLFAKFSLLFALNIGNLSAVESNKHTVEWQALQELYKVDLTSFVNFDGDIDFSLPLPDQGGVSSGPVQSGAMNPGEDNATYSDYNEGGDYDEDDDDLDY